MPKLLIVDDESDVREFARSFFKKRGIEVLLAAGGHEALKLIAGERPESVLLDVRMEQMTGVEVLRELRRLNDNTRVIMVTGVEEQETYKEANILGALSYIHKPLILEELEKVVLAQIKKQ